MITALSTGAWVGIVVGGLVLLWVVLTFNSFVRLRNKVNEAFSGIDVQLKRRHSLVPNLVKTVKAYARHEQETLEEVVAARGAAQDAEALADRQQSENGLSRSLVSRETSSPSAPTPPMMYPAPAQMGSSFCNHAH